MTNNRGRVYGLGIGPGDPDLMTVRAHKILQAARNIAYFRKTGRPGQARTIAANLIPRNAVEIPLEYPITTEIPFSDPRYSAVLSEFYEECTKTILNVIGRNEDVIVLCEGDPLFYGSFIHLYERLKSSSVIEVVPSVTGMSAAWTATGRPISWGNDVLRVLVGTLPEDVLTRHLQNDDAIVIMKIGRNFQKVCRALEMSGRYQSAWLIENASMIDQRVQQLRDVTNSVAPYFSIIVVHGQGRRY
ncbi:MAG: precorrin-2 C(20)-methyltransferase [Aestuariivita sp.]|nr:precorrin-2 C(20)-methyltransferase [Aestuariivita sp.]MCY4202676.1 precorrin-2 C(20)-methyltransferase [Aestuariivita sp.]